MLITYKLAIKATILDKNIKEFNNSHLIFFFSDYMYTSPFIYTSIVHYMNIYIMNFWTEKFSVAALHL